MRLKHLILLFIVAFVINSCDIQLGGKFDEGIIEYDLKYLEDENQNPIISLLPTTMSFQFKDNNCIQSVEGWMGIFKMGGIYNNDEQLTTAFLKISRT